MSHLDVGEALDKAKVTASEGATKAAEVAQARASVAWSDAISLGRTMTRAMRALRAYGLDDVLGLVGLRRSRGIVESFGTFSAGVAVGAGLGILFAPQSGAATRRSILDASKKALEASLRALGTEKRAEAPAGKKAVSDEGRVALS